MLFEIKSATRVVAVSALGAELQSIRSLATGDEFMWEGDPSVWSGIAPVLFPVVGGLKEDRMQWSDRTYLMEKHGFARHREFSCINQQNDSATFALQSDVTTRQIYPWEFELSVEFRLVEDALTITYRVKNTDHQSLLFNLGSHPAFRLPLNDADINDFAIVFSEPETLGVYRVVDDVLSVESKPYLDNEQQIDLTPTIFDHDALVFKHIQSRQIALVHNTRGPRVTVETGGAPHLGIWAKPAAPYVCIEPWWGHADFADASGQFAEKTDIQTLAPGDEFMTAITVTTHES